MISFVFSLLIVNEIEKVLRYTSDAVTLLFTFLVCNLALYDEKIVLHLSRHTALRYTRHIALHVSPPSFNSVTMTSLSVAVRLCPSERHNSISCFRDILPSPVLSYIENATLNSEEKKKERKIYGN